MGNTKIAVGIDPPYLDDFLVKGRRLDKTLEDFQGNPREWWDWDSAQDYSNFTVDMDDWRIHYNMGHPLCFYHNKQLAVGIYKPAEEIKVDQVAPDIVWARIDGYVVVERGDYPRFHTAQGTVRFSHTLQETVYPNVWDLGNGYAVACTRIIDTGPNIATVQDEAWWMVGPIEEAHLLSRQVLAVKIYDGPYPYSSRGTDIKLADPIPLPSTAEYVMYSYDAGGMRGLYRDVHIGSRPQKKAITIQGDSLLDRAVSAEGDVRLEQGRLVGSGTVIYELPIRATKMLSFYTRGNEVDARMRFDSGNPIVWEEYDGLAVNNLTLIVDYYESVSAIRLEWERLEDWEVAGRPKIDIEPAGWGGNTVRIAGNEGEGLYQDIDLESGEYSVSANVRCTRGTALIDVGGEQLTTWRPLDKSIRNGNAFVVGTGTYEFLLTGRDQFSYEVDRFRIATGNDIDWIEEEISWEVETDDHVFDALESVNREALSVSTGDIRRFRLRIAAPEDLGNLESVSVDRISAELFQTGSYSYEQVVRWHGEGPGRIHYPDTVTRVPVQGEYIPVTEGGVGYWSIRNRRSPGDVVVSVEGSSLAYSGNSVYLDVDVANASWWVHINETQAVVYHEGQEVARLSGSGLPFMLAHRNTEDVHLDTPAGFVQLRRGLGPRFQGWELVYSNVNVAQRGQTIAFGRNQDEADDNLSFYVIVLRG